MSNKKHVIMRNNNKQLIFLLPKKTLAFTLAEVLITLGIIGVVAAMTIPTLMTKINHIKLKSQFKEGYAILSQAVKMANDDGWEMQRPTDKPYLSSAEIGKVNEQAKEFLDYFKGATLCNDKDKDSTHCIGRTEKGNNGSVSVTNKDYKYTNYAKNSKEIWTNVLDDFQFYLPNNMLIIIDFNIEEWKNYVISIDVNGKGEKPNALGHDVFTFELKETEKSGGYELVPMGSDGTYFPREKYCSKSSTSGYNGLGCTYFAVQDETYFDKLP